jgi:hypothetical protein
LSQLDLKMSKRSPTHPGTILREDVLPNLAGINELLSKGLAAHPFAGASDHGIGIS